MIQVDIDNEVTDIACPSADNIEHWVKGALDQKTSDCTVAIKIINEAEMQALNHTYRHKSKPTNVLSFPTQLPEPLRGDFIGDIAICAPVVQKEASAQNKAFDAHFAHLVVHGILHLLGYDHENEADATKMESEEVRILHQLGFDDPYLIEITHD